MEPATQIIKKLGGVATIVEITGVHRTRVYAWMKEKERGGTGGVIPFSHAEAIIKYAKNNNIDLTANDFLPMAVPAA